MRIIDADKLYPDCLTKEGTLAISQSQMANAPIVNPKELKPLIDKIAEIMPELTDAIIKNLPKVISGQIKCSECSYYTNTFNGEWVRKEDVIHNIAEQYSAHNELVPIWLSIGSDMRGKDDADN